MSGSFVILCDILGATRRCVETLKLRSSPLERPSLMDDRSVAGTHHRQLPGTPGGLCHAVQASFCSLFEVSVNKYCFLTVPCLLWVVVVSQHAG